MPVVSHLFSLLLHITWRRRHPHLLIPFCCATLLTGLLLTACSSGGGSTSANSTIPLAQIHWCGKPSLLFRDEGASTPGTAATPKATTNGTPTAKSGTPKTITNWNQFKNSLGFTLYLPATLAHGTCLSSAFGTVHDPIFGSSFTIGFMLPNHDPITLSEAPLHTQSPKFQCSATAANNAAGTGTSTKQPPLELCTGAHKTTNIVFSALGSTSELQTFFQNLQPDVNWIPTT